MGGLIALEMAQILRRGGEEVDRLIMIDTYAPHLIREASPEVRKVSPERLDGFHGVFHGADHGALHALGRVMEANRASIRNYHPAPYDGSIELVRARDREDRGQPPALLGWDDLARGPLEVTTLAGDHRSLVLGEDVKALAEYLDRLLGD